ncbi:MAG: phage tail protein [Haloferacaceae archaeon]
MGASDRTDPYRGYRFLVEIESVIAAGFSEVSGLEVRMEPQTYQEGGVNDYTHRLPTRFDHANLVCKRGITDDTALVEWVESAVYGPPSPTEVTRKTVRVFLQDARGEEAWGWECREALPVRWTGPDLNATEGGVAVETVEFAHHGLQRVQGLP